jgi:acyl-lipid omega-6 desaturase (Delta-12 desaturase)
MHADPPGNASHHADRVAIIRSVKTYQRPDNVFSAFQLISTIGLLGLCYAAMYYGVFHHHDAVLLLAPIASGLTIRTFSLQHDCGHGSMFRARWANSLAGRVCGMLTFTPYDHWRRHHGIHHGGWNNIDARGRISNMYSDCTTVAEYDGMSSVQKLLYRLSKNPAVVLLVMPPIIFFVAYRIPFDAPPAWRRERIGVHLTNLGLVLAYGALVYLLGYKVVALVTLLVIYPASVIGVWLFLLQHTFEGVHWENGASWDSFEASLTGCSFLRLHPILTWFSGSIGLHHVHHAAPGIPNYLLSECHDAHSVFHTVKTIDLVEGLKAIGTHTLWDEAMGRMVPFDIVRRGHHAPAVG